MISFKIGGTLFLLTLLPLPSTLLAAQSPFEIELKELEREKPAASPRVAKKKLRKTKKASPVAGAARSGKPHKSPVGNAEYIRYAVKPGDHIFKILVTRFGMSNEAAERLIPEILRLNNIADIKNLKVGRVLLIPGRGWREREARSAQQGGAPLKGKDGSQPAALPATAAGLEGHGAESPRVEPPREPGKTPAALVAPPPISRGPAVPSAAAVPAPVTVAPPTISAAPVVPPANTWICSVTEKGPARIVDAVLNALSLSWLRNRIIQSDEGAANTFSIMVDRYFELKGVRYIVSIGESDPYTYTLIRLLEGAGYRVLMIGSGDDFKVVSEKLLRLVGLVPDFGKHVLQGGVESTGFLVRQDGAGGRAVVITSEAADPKLKWNLPAGCGAR